MAAAAAATTTTTTGSRAASGSPSCTTASRPRRCGKRGSGIEGEGGAPCIGPGALPLAAGAEEGAMPRRQVPERNCFATPLVYIYIFYNIIASILYFHTTALTGIHAGMGRVREASMMMMICPLKILFSSLSRPVHMKYLKLSWTFCSIEWRPACMVCGGAVIAARSYTS